MATAKRYVQDDAASILNCKSVDAAFDLLLKIMPSYGYEMVAFGCATECPSLGLEKKHGHMTNFPSEWIEHYAQNDFSEIDPVHIHAVQNKMPAFWSQCLKDAPHNSMRLMKDAADVGLKSGIIIPVFDTGEEISILSVSTNSYHGNVIDQRALTEIYFLSSYFFHTYKSLLKNANSVKLTEREDAVLCWAAEGKTDGEISDIVNISEATVRYHWGKIFEKLEVNKRTFAVSKAMSLRLIQPNKIYS